MKNFTRGMFAAALVFLAVSACRAEAEPKAYDYLAPDADVRELTPEEIGLMPRQVANYAKNEIYARHGRKFRSAELTEYFSQQPWYEGTVEPSKFDENVLNEFEEKNIELLSEREKRLSWEGEGYILDEEGYNFDAVTEYLSDDFNILEDMEVSSASGSDVMNTKHFNLIMPEDPQLSFIQLDRYTVEFYYVPGYESNFGGHLVTIRAFDPGDNEYEEYPAWGVVGENDEKKFVGIYPTDVQFNYEDETQKEEYMKLSEWAESLDDEENTFFTAIIQNPVPETTGAEETATDSADGEEAAPAETTAVSADPAETEDADSVYSETEAAYQEETEETEA